VGDEVWTQLVADHFELLRRVTERSAGTVVKTLGDGTMTAFGSARNAIDAAIGFQEGMVGSDLNVRIGVHTGDSLRKEGDYYGVAVNKAARIAAIASGGEIMVSAVTAELAGRQGFGFGSQRTVTLKGLDGTHVIVPVEWTPNQPSET
jgi:class 3 adenylate cyclase